MIKIFAYIQIISLALFLSLVIGKTIYLRKKEKISAIKINIFAKEGLKHIFEIIMFVSVNIWTFGLLAYALKDAFGIFSTLPEYKLFNLLYLKILGLFFIIIGFIFFVLALLNLGNSWRLGIDDKNPGKLVTSGIYSLSRHPIYLFFNLYFFGTFIINANIIFLIFTIILASVLHIQIIREEKFLVKVFGKEYTNYMQSVSRYLTFKTFANRKKFIYLFRFEKAE